MTAARINPGVIEIVGVAGAGKSTLTGALLARHEGLQLGDTLHMRRPEHWLAALRGAVRGLPVIVAGCTGARRLRWDDARFVLYVAGWSRRLARQRSDGEHLLLDQGPVFALARLRVGGAGVTDTTTYRRWEAAMIDEWARVLDVVVWLDADDSVVGERINGRRQPHAIKGAPPERAGHFLADYRHAYDALVARMERADRGPRVVRIDSSAFGPTALADEVERILGLDRGVAGGAPLTGVEP